MTVDRILFAAQDGDPVIMTTRHKPVDAYFEPLTRRDAVILNVSVLVVHSRAGWPSAKFLTHRYVSKTLNFECSPQDGFVKLRCIGRLGLAPDVGNDFNPCM